MGIQTFKPKDGIPVGTPGRQVAALCYRVTKKGNKKVLLITSRDTGRWILPKGWMMKGKSAHEAAEIEAWEEAGVKDAQVKTTPLGTYEYEKTLNSGGFIPCEVEVYRMKVRDLADKFPEADERDRKWVKPKKAAKMVDEPELKALLKAF